MSYTPSTDFLALLRNTGGGERFTSQPGVDYVIAALARAGLIALVVSQSAPTVNQAVTVWFQPATQSWAGEGTVWLWNAAAQTYQNATPALWSVLLAQAAKQTTTLVTTSPYAAQPTDQVLLVNAPGAANINVNWAVRTQPLRTVDASGAAATNNITITPTAGQTQLGQLNYVYTIDENGGSVTLTPLPNGTGAY